MIRNIIILGDEGNANTVQDAINVDDGYIFTFTTAAQTTLDIDAALQKAVPADTVGKIHWIGHGNPSKLILPNDQVLTSAQAALFFAGLNPQRIILWSCNTGIKVADNALSATLWNEYNRAVKGKYGKPEIVGRNMSITVPAANVNGHVNPSFAKKLAAALSGRPSSVEVFGPPKGVLPGSIKDFAHQCPSLIQWQSNTNLNGPPTTSTAAYAHRSIAVVANGSYKIVCNYKPNNGNFVFTYKSIYLGS